MAGTTGLVLAAGAGTRAGGPKALLRMPDGTPWLARASAFLTASGCDRVIVVLGAQARIARPLRRAVFDGRPGHPVFVAAEHLAPLAATLSGDSGGREYLDAHGVLAVECGDLSDGRDRDRG